MNPKQAPEAIPKTTLRPYPQLRPRIGVFGGAFDPPHLGHFKLAQSAIIDLQLDSLIIVPTGQGLHKSRCMSPEHHRLKMTQLAFQDLPNARVDPCELDRGGVSYTIDTVLSLSTQLPGSDFYLIIGADQAEAFDTWHRWTDILQIVTLAVAARSSQIQPDTTLEHPKVELESYKWHNQALAQGIQKIKGHTDPRIAVSLHMPCMPVSATQIRSTIQQQGGEVSQWLNPLVLAYIRSHFLYTP